MVITTAYQGFVGKHRRGRGGTFSASRSPVPSFSADTDTGALVLTGGTGPISITRASTKAYAASNSKTGILFASSGVIAAESFQYAGSSTRGGFLSSGSRKNLIINSDDMTAAGWTLVGTATRGNVASDTPFGGSTATQLNSFAVDDGILVGSATTSVNKTSTFTIYLKSTGLAFAAKIYIEGSSGAFPETVTKAITVNPTWGRFDVGVTFTAAATGNISGRVTFDAGSKSAFMSGGMLTNSNDGTFGERRTGPSAHVVTSGAAANDAADVISIPAANLDPLLGTFSCWINVPYNGTTIGSGNSKAIFDLNGGTNLLAGSFRFSTGVVRLMYAGAQVANGVTALVADTWYHLVFTWNQPNSRWKVYLNGAQDATGATSQTAQVADTIFFAPSTGTAGLYLDGTEGRPRIWKNELSASQVVQLFNAQRGFYGV